MQHFVSILIKASAQYKWEAEVCAFLVNKDRSGWILHCLCGAREAARFAQDKTWGGRGRKSGRVLQGQPTSWGTLPICLKILLIFSSWASHERASVSSENSSKVNPKWWPCGEGSLAWTQFPVGKCWETGGDVSARASGECRPAGTQPRHASSVLPGAGTDKDSG